MINRINRHIYIKRIKNPVNIELYYIKHECRRLQDKIYKNEIKIQSNNFYIFILLSGILLITTFLKTFEALLNK